MITDFRQEHTHMSCMRDVHTPHVTSRWQTWAYRIHQHWNLSLSSNTWECTHSNNFSTREGHFDHLRLYTAQVDTHHPESHKCAWLCTVQLQAIGIVHINTDTGSQDFPIAQNFHQHLQCCRGSQLCWFNGNHVSSRNTTVNEELRCRMSRPES